MFKIQKQRERKQQRNQRGREKGRDSRREGERERESERGRAREGERERESERERDRKRCCVQRDVVWKDILCRFQRQPLRMYAFSHANQNTHVYVHIQKMRESEE